MFRRASRAQNTLASVSVFPFLLGRENFLTEETWKRPFLVGSRFVSSPVGFPPRGGFPAPRADLERRNWVLGLSLGRRTGRQCHTLPCSSELASACTRLSPPAGEHSRAESPNSAQLANTALQRTVKAQNNESDKKGCCGVRTRAVSEVPQRSAVPQAFTVASLSPSTCLLCIQPVSQDLWTHISVSPCLFIVIGFVVVWRFLFFSWSLLGSPGWP